MAIADVISKIESLKEWEALLAEAQEQVESIKDELKAHMNANGLEELEAGTHIVRYTTVKTNRFDSTAFKKEHLDLYKEFTKLTTSRRFAISG